MAPPKCLRCANKADPMQAQHDHLGTCTRTPFLLNQASFLENKLWPDFPLGQKSDDIGGVLESDDLLKAAMAGGRNHAGRDITKHMLENAWVKVFTARGKNQADMLRAKEQKNQSRPAPTPKQQLADRTKASAWNPQGAWNKPLPTSGSSKTAVGNTATQSTFKTDFRINTAPEVRTKDYPWAVHDAKLDHTLVSNAPGSTQTGSFTVATNYVAIKQTPQKVYMYGITYGTITGIKTKKQRDDDTQAKQGEEKTTGERETESADVSAADGGEGDGRSVGQRSEKARIFKALQGLPPFDNTPWATDYDFLWTLKPLSKAHETITDVTYAKLSGRNYKLNLIEFNYIRELDLSPDAAEASKSLLNQAEVTKKGGSLRITALNALVARHLTSHSNAVVQVGPNKFFLKGGFEPAPALLDIHRGYYTSVRPGFSNVLLNINVATAAFYKPMKVSDFYKIARDQFRAYGNPEDLLKGLTVRIAYERTTHDKEYDPNLEEHRHRVIAGFGDVPFKQELGIDGHETVGAYFENELGARIMEKQLPCISVNIAPPKDGGKGKGKGKGKVGKTDNDKTPARPQWIPQEFLTIDPYQPFKSLLQGTHTEQMLKVALRHPAKNQDLIITEGFGLLGIGQPNSGLDQLQLTVGDKLLAVPARQLPVPRIAYRPQNRPEGQNRFAASDRPAVQTAEVKEASWNLRGVNFFVLPTMRPAMEVCTIDMRTHRRPGEVQSLGARLSKTMRDHGITFAQNAAKTSGYKDTISSLDRNTNAFDIVLYNQLEADIKALGGPEMLLVLLSEKDTGLYGSVKRVCDQWLGVHTVCLVVDKLYKYNNYQGPQGPLLSNLALKFNMKLRGQNHQVSHYNNANVSAFNSIAADTIVLGADVSHPAGGMPYTPSVAAVVGSDDRHFANFPGSMRLQAGTQEMIDELEDMVHERLRRYYDNNQHTLPKRMLFYRDGVSEDQFAKCRAFEIPQIENAFDRIKKEKQQRNARLELTFIVVGKRHHTRFFAREETQTYPDERGGRPMPNKQPARKFNGNLKPGLLVDQVITRPPVDGTFDFFLQSHAALKGTARAAHYSVLTCGASFNASQLQQLTHAFCYNYMRATKGVSYAGPAYYADRLCDRGSHYLRGYTMHHQRPEIEMDARELGMGDKKEAAMAFAKRVAENISATEVWNPWLQDDAERKNPWHKEFDNCMFWL